MFSCLLDITHRTLILDIRSSDNAGTQIRGQVITATNISLYPIDYVWSVLRDNNITRTNKSLRLINLNVCCLGLTPIHLAAAKNKLDTLKWLSNYLKNHYDNSESYIDARALNGETPLYFAAQEGHLQIVTWLVEKVCHPVCTYIVYSPAPYTEIILNILYYCFPLSPCRLMSNTCL